MSETTAPTTETLRGMLDHVTFRNEETGFTIARLLREPGKTPVTVVGTIPSCTLGENVEVTGEWKRHPAFGDQLRLTSYRTLLPSSVEGIRRYLGSGLIKGIGPAFAGKIVDAFGSETLEIISKTPSRLREIDGIGTKRIKEITAAWREQAGIRELMLFLQHNEIPTGVAHRIYRKYGPDSVAVIKNDPFRLADEIWGIGFKKADQIAERVGIGHDDPRRLAAGIKYVLNRATEQGHTFVPVRELLETTAQQLEVPDTTLTQIIETIARSGDIICEQERVALPRYVNAEQEIGTILASFIKQRPSATANEAQASVIERVENRTGVRYAPEQAQAIMASLQEGVLIITGGPGTGKTTTTQGIVSELREQGHRLVLCAPTGRAAKRLSEVTGCEARTIHRLLGFAPGEKAFQHDQRHPLPVGVVLVDEASMVDTELFLHLLRALAPGSRLILVGDADQLPSVGPGQVLRDAIASGVITTIALRTVFRQAQASLIVTNAHSINRGEMPPLSNSRDGDFFFIYKEDPEEIASTIADLVSRRLPFRYKLNRFSGIQVLAPMYRGETGAIALNRMLQEKLNPRGEAILRGATEFRVGDKVIVTRNNYNKMVFNGDIGRIAGINREEGKVSVDLNFSAADTVRVTYDSDELDELSLAYAVSVHRSQGSEFPAVVMPITTQHFMMLQRNVLYTAVTRAKKLMVLVGSKKALAIAIRNGNVSQRHTMLAQTIRRATESETPEPKRR